MEVKIFDTHVRTRDGRYLHFDVLVTEELGARAGEFARRWLAGRPISARGIAATAIARLRQQRLPKPFGSMAITSFPWKAVEANGQLPPDRLRSP